MHQYILETYLPKYSRLLVVVAIMFVATSVLNLLTASAQGSTVLPNNVSPVQATYQGVKVYNGFYQSDMEADAWTYGDIAFYAPTGLVSQENANRWLAWYARADEIHRTIVPRTDESFEQIYRADDPNFGRKKVLAFVNDLDGAAGLGTKQRAEAGVYDLQEALQDPANVTHHYTLIYEMMRSWSGETSDYRGMWPQEQVMLPHLMASFVYYDVGGIETLLQDEYRHNIPSKIYRDLDSWQQDGHDYVTYFPDKEQTFFTEYHPILPSIVLRVGVENDFLAVRRILENLSTYPSNTSYDSATQALCDFQAAVNDATNDTYKSRMINDWGLPSNCVEPSSPETYTNDLRFEHSELCIDVESGVKTDGQFNAAAVAIPGQNVCNGSDTQRLEEVPHLSGGFTVKLTNSDRCLDESGGNLGVWTCHGAANQVFNWVGEQLQVVGSGNCITVPGGALNRGANLTLEPCTNGLHQRFGSSAPTPTPTNTPMPTATPALTALGDVNCDNRVNVVDALYIMQHEVSARADSGACPETSADMSLHLQVGDVNSDENVDVLDALAIMQCEAQISNLFCP